MQWGRNLVATIHTKGESPQAAAAKERTTKYFSIVIFQSSVANEEAYILTVFLQLQPLGGRTHCDASAGVFDRHIVVDLQPVPPDGRLGGFDCFVAVPTSRFELEMEPLPFDVRPPGVYVLNRQTTKPFLTCTVRRAAFGDKCYWASANAVSALVR